MYQAGAEGKHRAIFLAVGVKENGAPGGSDGACLMCEKWRVDTSSEESSMSVVTDSRVARVMMLREGYSEPVTTAQVPRFSWGA